MARFVSHGLMPEFDVQIGAEWHPSSDLQPEVESLWQRELDLHGEACLFNGPLFVLTDMEPHRLVIQRSEYRYALARRTNPDLFARGLSVRPWLSRAWSGVPTDSFWGCGGHRLPLIAVFGSRSLQVGWISQTLKFRFAGNFTKNWAWTPMS
jgi:hypothetical protein